MGWVLLPLRLFLGVTFVYAGVLKLSDHAYFDPSAPTGVEQQMRLAQTQSPISGLVEISAQHAVLFGLLIALGELAVGLGVLLGLWTRLSAVGGMLLALSFFLTVSWTTRPYFFGSDIVFLFAFSPLAVAGDGGVLSWGAALRRSTRRDAGLSPEPSRKEPADVVEAVNRRTLLRTGVAAACVGTVTALAATGARLLGGDSGAATTSSLQPSASPTPTRAPKPSSSPSSDVPKGAVALGSASSVPVGSSAQFTDPKTGQPGIVVQPKAGTYLAYSSVCTHQGCTVGYDGSQLACPCHGATYDAANGDVTGGPAPSPLARITVVEAGGKLYAV